MTATPSTQTRAAHDRLAAIAPVWYGLPGTVRWALWLAGAYAILVLRRPETLLRPQFLNEDGPVFFIGAFFGSPLQILLRPYNGYLHLVPRLVALLERLVPIVWAPFVSNACALAITAAVAAFVASDRMAEVMPERPLRWAAGALILLLPASHETLGSITYAQFYLGLYLLTAAAATPPSGGWQRLGDRVSLVLASLTGPFGVLAAPLFLVRGWRRRTGDSLWAAACVTIPAAVQVWAYIVFTYISPTAAVGGPPTPAAAPGPVTPFVLAQIVGLRMVDVPLIGVLWSLEAAAVQVPFLVSAIATLLATFLLVVAARRLAPSRALVLAYAWVIVGAAALTREGTSVLGLLNPGQDERYFLIPTALVGLTIIVWLGRATGRERGPALLLACLLALGVVGDFRLPPWPASNWAQVSACIGGPSPCSIPEYQNWTIYWPGVNATYQQP